MVNKKTCEHKEYLKKENLFGAEYLFCQYAEKNGCPYENGQKLSWEGDSAGTVCLSEGLVKNFKSQTLNNF